MNNIYDPEKLRITTGTPKGIPKTIDWPYKPQKGEMFLKGPIPQAWLAIAAKCAGRALHVAIALWHYAGLTKSITIRLNQSRLLGFGLSRDSARRGLLALENAKLITVVRAPGRKPQVTIILNNENIGRGAGTIAEVLND